MLGYALALRTWLGGPTTWAVPIFATVFIVVFASTVVPLRGLGAFFVQVAVVALGIGFTLFGGSSWFLEVGGIDMTMSASAYVFIATAKRRDLWPPLRPSFAVRRSKL